MPENETEILRIARERFKKALDADARDREEALDDLNFLNGNQWPDGVRADREADKRPCLTINKLPSHLDQVVGFARQNRPQITVKPVDDKADIKTAEIIAGMIKNIEITSNANIVYDHAYEHSAGCGRGAFRVVTEYSSNKGFDQEILIKKIFNAFSVYWDPEAIEYDRSDARWCFVTENIDRDEYKKRFGIEPTTWSSAQGTGDGWSGEKTIRIAEYFEKVTKKEKLNLLTDGRTVKDQDIEAEDKIEDTREVEPERIVWRRISGDDILEENDWPGSYIPIIPIWGKELIIDGERYTRGIVRHAKDPQRLYNYWRSAETEMVALAPKSPYLATSKMVGKHLSQWNSANQKNWSVLLYEPDDQVAGGHPIREHPPQMSSGMVNEINTADQEIRDTTGQHQASLGMTSNEKSGLAIQERRAEGDQATYAYFDNLVRSITYCGRVILDLIPKIYDAKARAVRLGLIDGSFDTATIKNPDIAKPGEFLNDPSIGKYDIVVTVGPSYATQRQQASQEIRDLIQADPEAAPLIADILAAKSDWPGADLIAKRLLKRVPRELLTQEDLKKIAADESTNEPPNSPPGAPPVATSPPAGGAPPPQPDPAMMIELETAQVKLAQEKAKLEGINLDNEIKMAQSGNHMKQTIKQIMEEGRAIQP